MDQASRHDERLLVGALSLIVVFMALEVAVALVSHSLALLSDAGHMVTDAGALLAAIGAARLAARPARGVWTYGLKRAEILAAAGNGVALLVIAALVCFEAVLRLMHPPAVQGTAVLAVALAGVAVNLGATFLLARASRTSLNVEGAFQHIVTDLLAFVATAIAGVVLMTTGFRRADSIASLVVVVLMVRASYRLLGESGRVLLEAAPANVGLADVRAHMLAVP
ncbi:MAG: cation diffusion facilitator family transporter, partial [Actinomycetota bacterium]|nr:cation diffusion facilitator family transporter [Actinomycetota bacterium]